MIMKQTSEMEQLKLYLDTHGVKRMEIFEEYFLARIISKVGEYNVSYLDEFTISFTCKVDNNPKKVHFNGKDNVVKISETETIKSGLQWIIKNLLHGR